MTDNPLTEPQIHHAIRALDAGDRPARATLRTALLMALAWHAAQAEIAALRAALQGLRRAHTISSDYYETCPKAWSEHTREYIRTHHTDWEDWLTAPCSCGAAEHNAKIAVLLGEPPEPPEPPEPQPLAPGPQMG